MMKQIELTQGQYALVDDKDYEWLNQYKWYACKERPGNFYAVRNSSGANGKRHTIKMHRQLLGLEYGDKREGDHWDHNTLNNCRNNIRICTHKQNGMNRKPDRNTSSRYRGVSWNTWAKKWVAQTTIDGERTHLGYYNDEEIAALAFDLVARKAYGKFAYLNFLPPHVSLCKEVSVWEGIK